MQFSVAAPHPKNRVRVGRRKTVVTPEAILRSLLRDENGHNGLDSSYTNASRCSKLVEVCLLPVYRPL